jgi:hypothetical protein
MAMSLADELGGEMELDPHFDDGPSNTGLGLSLADELELDLELNHNFHDNDKDDENDNEPSAPNERTNNQYLSPSPPTPNIKLSKSSSKNHTTPRRARTSATSTYYTATASPGRLSALDSGDEVDQSLYQIGQDDSLEINSSGGDEGDSVPDLETDGDRSRDSLFSINGAGLPTPKMEEDMIAAIQDQVDDIARFVNSLKQIEPEPPVKPQAEAVEVTDSVLNHSLNRSRPSTSDSIGTRGKDGVLGSYLEAVERTGKASEEQTKELSTIRKDFASTPPTPEFINGLLDVLGPIEPETTTPLITVNDESSLEIISEEASFEQDETPVNPDESYTTAHDPEISVVSDTIQEIISENKSLVSDLKNLSESVHLNQSIQTSTTRQIKGLKSTLMTWEERKAMEERAKVAIEQWERSQIQRGLRGEKGTREVLDEVLMGFHRTLEECERRMKMARAKYAVPAATA